MPKIEPLHRLICLSVMINVAANAARFTVLLYAIRLGASPVQAGLIGAVYALLPALVSVQVGNLVDRIGTRRPMLAASGLLTIALAISSDSLPVLFLVAALCGISNNTWFISHQQLVGAYAPPGQSASGYIASALGFSIAALIAPVTAGAGADLLGFRGILLAFAALPLTVNVLLWRRMLPAPEARPRPLAGPRGSALDLLANAGLRRTFIVGAMFEMSWTLFAFLVPLRGSALGLPATQIGIIAGSLSISSFSCRLVLPWLLRRFPNWRLLICALCVLGAGYAGMAIATSFIALVACGLVVGAGQSMGAPLVNSLLYEGAPQGRSAQAIALRTTISYSLQTTLPLSAGALASALGAAAGFWLLAGVLFAVTWYARPAWKHALPAGDG